MIMETPTRVNACAEESAGMVGQRGQIQSPPGINAGPVRKRPLGGQHRSNMAYISQLNQVVEGLAPNKSRQHHHHDPSCGRITSPDAAAPSRRCPSKQATPAGQPVNRQAEWKQGRAGRSVSPQVRRSTGSRSPVPEARNNIITTQEQTQADWINTAHSATQTRGRRAAANGGSGNSIDVHLSPSPQRRKSREKKGTPPPSHSRTPIQASRDDAAAFGERAAQPLPADVQGFSSRISPLRKSHSIASANTSHSGHPFNAGGAAERSRSGGPTVITYTQHSTIPRKPTLRHPLTYFGRTKAGSDGINKITLKPAASAAAAGGKGHAARRTEYGSGRRPSEGLVAVPAISTAAKGPRSKSNTPAAKSLSHRPTVQASQSSSSRRVSHLSATLPIGSGRSNTRRSVGTLGSTTPAYIPQRGSTISLDSPLGTPFGSHRAPKSRLNVWGADREAHLLSSKHCRPVLPTKIRASQHNSQRMDSSMADSATAMSTAEGRSRRPLSSSGNAVPAAMYSPSRSTGDPNNGREQSPEILHCDKRELQSVAVRSRSDPRERSETVPPEERNSPAVLENTQKGAGVEVCKTSAEAEGNTPRHPADACESTGRSESTCAITTTYLNMTNDTMASTVNPETSPPASVVPAQVEIPRLVLNGNVTGDVEVPEVRVTNAPQHEGTGDSNGKPTSEKESDAAHAPHSRLDDVVTILPASESRNVSVPRGMNGYETHAAAQTGTVAASGIDFYPGIFEGSRGGENYRYDIWSTVTPNTSVAPSSRVPAHTMQHALHAPAYETRVSAASEGDRQGRLGCSPDVGNGAAGIATRPGLLHLSFAEEESSRSVSNERVLDRASPPRVQEGDMSAENERAAERNGRNGEEEADGHETIPIVHPSGDSKDAHCVDSIAEEHPARSSSGNNSTNTNRLASSAAPARTPPQESVGVTDEDHHHNSNNNVASEEEPSRANTASSAAAQFSPSRTSTTVLDASSLEENRKMLEEALGIEVVEGLVVTKGDPHKKLCADDMIILCEGSSVTNLYSFCKRVRAAVQRGATEFHLKVLRGTAVVEVSLAINS